MSKLVFPAALAWIAVVSADAQIITDRDTLHAIASAKGWTIRESHPAHGVIQLHSIVNGRPRYLIAHNLIAAQSVSADECWPGGSGGYTLTGSGVTLGIWDAGGVHTPHQEFGGRATQRDNPYYDDDSHATHVAGTMIAAGTWPGGSGHPAGSSKGMSYQGSLNCYDWDYDFTEMNSAAQQGLRVSNHSYGLVAGWSYEWWYGAWFWYGDVTVSTVEDYQFGRYNEIAVACDQIARNNPYYLIVTSAGNDRDESHSGGHYYFDPVTQDWEWSTAPRNPDGPYDCVSYYAVAKNVLTVGAVRDVPGGYTSPGSVSMTTFSCWGPTDDGRIKPDVVGNGYELWSPSYWNGPTWMSMSGTSMSSPNVAGTCGLLIQRWRQTHAGEPDMLSSTLKGLLIHTADDCGTTPGPDYAYGWGLVNALKAANAISFDLEQPLTISEYVLETAMSEITLDLGVDGTASQLRATLCWTDPAGTPPHPSVDDPTPMLVNNLDMRIVGPDGTTHYPWVPDLNSPGSGASQGDNDVDNVEQIVINTPAAGTYQLRIYVDGTLTGGPQKCSLIITGLPSRDCNGNGVFDDQDIADGTSQDCNGDGIPDECQTGLTPAIQTHPAPVEACPEKSIVLSVEATGPGPFTYQWRKDGEPLDGANDPTLVIDAAGAGDAGQYDVIVANTCGSVTSDPAGVTVEGPTITAQPESQSATIGSAVTLSVSATGPQLTYQWYKDGVLLFGQTAATYVIQTLGVDHLGDYHVEVGSACGPISSEAATLSGVLAAPGGPSPSDDATNVRVNAYLSWAAIPGASEYKVYFGTTQNPPLVGTVSQTRWTPDQALEYSTRYYWRLTAANPAVGQTSGAVWSFVTEPMPPQPPEKPLNPSPADGATNVPLDVSFDWDDAAGAHSYQILVGVDPNFVEVEFVGNDVRSAWRALPLTHGTTYYWKVIARNYVGHTASDVWSFTTVAPPAQVPATDEPDQSGQEQPDDAGEAPPPTEEEPALASPSALCPLTSVGMVLVGFAGLLATRRRGVTWRNGRA